MSFGSLPSVLGNGGGVAISVIGGTGLFADGTAAAPSISFASAPTNGIYYAGGNEVGISNNGILRWKSTYASATNHRFQANGGGYLDATSNGAIGLVAAGTNQNITLTPSGTGEVSASSNIVLGVANNKLRSGVSNGYITPEDGNIGCVIYSAGGVDFRRNSGTQAMRLVGNNGNLLLNTTTDSGALLQIGTNTTTSAGGVILGTDCPFYRIAAGIVRADFDFRVNGNLNLSTNTINALGGSLVFASNNTTALTLDSSQNATFAKNVVARGALGYATGIHSGSTADSSQQLILSSSGAYSNAYVSKNGTTLGIGFSSSNTSFVEDNALSIVAATKAATFAGAVTVTGALKLGNAYVAGAVVGTGYVTIQDSTGTTYRVPVLV